VLGGTAEFIKVAVQGYRALLEAPDMSTSAINVQLADFQ